MWTQTLTDLDAFDIQQLVDDGTEESTTLEYKQQFPQGSDDDRREFLYDVAALANTAGGFLLFGISEKRDAENKPTGIAGEIVGVESANLSAQVARLENIIRDGIAPRLSGIFSKVVACGDRTVFAFSVPKSWNAPHMVTFKQVNKFYGRVTSGKYPMSIDEIRRSFSQGAELGETIRAWRRHRFALLKENAGPVDLQHGPTMLLHVIPASAFALPSITSTWTLSQQLRLKMHCASTGFSGKGRYNGDGFLKWVDMSGEPTTGYTQVFRNGIIEYVTASFSWSTNGTPAAGAAVFTKLLEQELIQGYRDAINTYKELKISASTYVGFSIFGLSGRRMYIRPQNFLALPVLRDDQVESPEILVDPESSLESLKILADLMWQAGGLEESPSIDKGKWDPFVDR